MNRNKLMQMLRITGKYYIQHMSQKDIADEENVSVPTVSRMINRAMESGYVNISIDYSFLTDSELAEEIRDKYGLRQAIIAPAVISDPQAILLDTCRMAAAHLNEVLESDMIIGTAWGNTMKCLASCIEPAQRGGIKVVQLNGRVPDIVAAQGADDMVKAMVAAYGAEGYTIPAPAVVDDARTAALLREDSGIRSVLELAEQCSAAIFSVGILDRDSIMSKAGFLDHGLYESLLERGAVGDIASGYFDREGRPVDQDLKERRLSLPLEDFKKIPNKICVAAGTEKAVILNGAIRGGYVDDLVADEELGRALLML